MKFCSKEKKKFNIQKKRGNFFEEKFFSKIFNFRKSFFFFRIIFYHILQGVPIIRFFWVMSSILHRGGHWVLCITVFVLFFVCTTHRALVSIRLRTCLAWRTLLYLFTIFQTFKMLAVTWHTKQRAAFFLKNIFKYL